MSPRNKVLCAFLFVAGCFIARSTEAASNALVDCSCITNLSIFQTNGCLGIVPDLCDVATNCFSNVPMVPGYCSQSPGPNTPVGPGITTIQLTVTDSNNNSATCFVDYVVTAPPANLSLVCASNKAVECNMAWQFDPPIPSSTCCNQTFATIVLSSITNGTCPQVITRTWQVTDGCSNTATCSQTVTVVDTTPPVAQCSSFNLVPNPDFEGYTNCPGSLDNLDYASPWFKPSMGTADYYNSCCPVGNGASTPLSVSGNQVPHSGQGYGGAIVYTTVTDPTNSYREYLEVPLIAPLQAGQTYRVSFYVSAADNYGWAIADIGAYFSANPIVNYASFTVFNLIPQVVNPPSNPLTSTNSWMLVQGVFTAAGGESYMTIGNFRPDATTTAVASSGPFTGYAYYFFDDVSVEAVCTSSATNKVIPCGAPVVFDPPIGYDNCSGTNVTVTVAATVTNACPRTVTRTWALTDLCGNTNYWSQTVSFVDTNPPYVACSTNNLVPNSDFELYNPCPNNLMELNYAAPWFTPTAASPDYFNTCAFFFSSVSVPANIAGNQSPLSGQGYAGAELFAPGNNNAVNSYREYIEAPLTAPLVAGQKYLVSFNLSLADNSGYAVAEASAALTSGPLVNFAIQSCLTATPQVTNPSSNPLTDTNSWTLVQGIVTAAGGEDYLTLGNFLSDAASTGVTADGSNPFAYYYYEDVSVVPICPMATNKSIQCGMPLAFDQPILYDPCGATNINPVVATVTNTLCPLVVTRTWTWTNACGNIKTWTQTIMATNASPPVLNCFCLSELGSALLYTNGCAGIVPNLLQLTNCFSNSCVAISASQSPAPGTAVGPGTHPITVSVTDCFGGSNGCVLPFTVNDTPLSIQCPRDMVLLTCASSAQAWYTPIVSGNYSSLVCTPPSGSFFPVNQSTLVTCTASNDCGGVATCTFAVTVVRPPGRWPCLTIIAVGIGTIPHGTVRITSLPPLPGGGQGVDIENLGSSGQDGALLDIGPAQKLTFSTVLDFNAEDGASFNINVPNPNTGATIPWLTFTKSCQPPFGWQIKAASDISSDPNTKFRSIVIGTNGELYSSFVQTAAELDTNIQARLTPGTGVTGAVVTVTLDLRAREISLGIPDCAWTPDLARKGWDGLVYGNLPRGTTMNQQARLILTPLIAVAPTPITNIDLVCSNLPTLPFDNPSLTAMGRPWSDGYCYLLKAQDDGEQGIEIAAFGTNGTVATDLGNAASFNFQISHFQSKDVPNQQQLFTIRGWPPGTTTNRPPPPPIYLRLAQNSGGSGIDCAVDYTGFGISNVTLQLWNEGVMVGERTHVAANVESPLATLSDFPLTLGCPGAGVLSLIHTNPFFVLSGIDCPGSCLGTELRILPEGSLITPVPVAFGPLEFSIAPGMDNLLYGLETFPALTPVPLNVERAPAGIILSWLGDGFHLLGAENVNGPWYDLGRTSPVPLGNTHSARFFRLLGN